MVTILVIEDDPQILKMLGILLSRASYTVLQAKHGKEGIDLYMEHDVQLVITDIFMPEQEGIATIREMLKHDPKTKIIAISGGNPLMESSDYLRHAELFGAMSTFQKPINHQDLLQEVRRLIAE